MNTKKTYFRNLNTKIRNQNSTDQPTYPQRIKKPKKGAVNFKYVKTEEAFSSPDQKLVETTNL